ncbi:hypothetical protein DPMN_139935 [Dreissena polymorpha]|uniref:Uncharacterized protein n=1 Tax=Dreissena polymorpha TaxID=45954 RepID=A0A9D4G6N6_DREPO|nr:hypothetical protein DPMN_139935 [Dreissena polymorpha]
MSAVPPHAEIQLMSCSWSTKAVFLNYLGAWPNKFFLKKTWFQEHFMVKVVTKCFRQEENK